MEHLQVYAGCILWCSPVLLRILLAYNFALLTTDYTIMFSPCLLVEEGQERMSERSAQLFQEMSSPDLICRTHGMVNSATKNCSTSRSLSREGRTWERMIGQWHNIGALTLWQICKTHCRKIKEQQSLLQEQVPNFFQQTALRKCAYLSSWIHYWCLNALPHSHWVHLGATNRCWDLVSNIEDRCHGLWQSFHLHVCKLMIKLACVQDWSRQSVTA